MRTVEDADRHRPGYESLRNEIVRQLVKDVGLLRRGGFFEGNRFARPLPHNGCSSRLTATDASELSGLLNSECRLTEWFSWLELDMNIDTFMHLLNTADITGNNVGRTTYR